jgi:hypothetical protein
MDFEHDQLATGRKLRVLTPPRKIVAAGSRFTPTFAAPSLN